MVYVPPKDRVLETSNSNSQTVFALSGAVDTSYNAFSASMSVGDTTIGAVVEPGVAFRSGTLTYTAANQITVTKTKENKGTFSASGTKEVFMGEPAAYRATGPYFSFEGDSLTDATISMLGTWPLYLAQLSGFFDRGTKNYFGVSGDTAAAMVGEYAAEAGAVTLPPGSEAYFFLWAGTNDVSGSTAAATIYGYLTTMWAAARASGYLVVAFTIMPRNTFDAPREAIRVALNALILSDATKYDFLMRPDLLFTTPTDAITFLTDGIHLSAAGNLQLAKAVIGTVLGTPSLPAAPLDSLAYSGMQINGSMEVDQANIGALVSAINGPMVDGWSVQKSGTMVLAAQQVTDAPAGYANSLKVTVTTAQAVLGATDYARIKMTLEFERTSRLGWGFPQAMPVAIGFWSKHHRTGLYSGAISSFSNNRSIPFSYTQAVADVWQFNTVALPGDTTGTGLWVASSGAAVRIFFAIGAGSSLLGTSSVFASSDFTGATGQVNGVAALTDTFQITGIVFVPGLDLPGAARAPAIMRPFDQEILICRRFFQKTWNYATAVGNATLIGALTARCGSTENFNYSGAWPFTPEMYANPTITIYSPNTGASGKGWNSSGGDFNAAVTQTAGQKSVNLQANNVSTTSGTSNYAHATADCRI